MEKGIKNQEKSYTFLFPQIGFLLIIETNVIYEQTPPAYNIYICDEIDILL